MAWLGNAGRFRYPFSAGDRQGRMQCPALQLLGLVDGSMSNPVWLGSGSRASKLGVREATSSGTLIEQDGMTLRDWFAGMALERWPQTEPRCHADRSTGNWRRSPLKSPTPAGTKEHCRLWLTPNFQAARLYHGDNLDFLRGMNSESLDLIATDPHFQKGQGLPRHATVWRQAPVIQDRWSWRDDVHDDWIDQIRDDIKSRVWNAVTSAKVACLRG